jgi:RNA-directed DNA polymerase
VRWSFEAALGSCCDSLERTERKKRRAVRGADGALLRLIGQCVPVGGRDGEAYVEPEVGPVQGSVLAPLWGHVSLPSVLDLWCATAVKPRLQGTATLLRSCDDCIIGFAREDDAPRGLAVLGKRRGRFGLTRHPDKTRRWPCRRPPQAQQRGKGPATCDLLGGTCDWTQTRTGYWRMGCKPRRASLRRAQQALYAWGRRQRHQPVEAQHAARGRRLRGHCTSCGGRGNFRCLLRLVAATQRAWSKGRCRRSQRKRLTWERCTALLRQRPLPRPRITVRLWGV